MSKISNKQIELNNHGFECKPGEGHGKYPFLVIDHNDNDEKLYFTNVDQAFFIIMRDYVKRDGK